MSANSGYEVVVGLEVHVELSTKTKIFCGCPTAFGGEPNTQVCPACLGMPGTLPVLNKQVVEFALRAGLALDCDITRNCRFDRKNYFYPDLPKAYQVSQLYLPICKNGKLEIETEAGKKEIGIHEIHMEEDAGKLIHDPWEEITLIDCNRGGVPLLEIVSKPDFRSADEVVAYLEALREILLFLDVSDCKMQEGSMRADVNLSVRKPGEAMGVRTEMKNLNSLKMAHRAVLAEAKRHIEALEGGGKIVQETRRWDDNKGASFSMRTKEDAQDYRYFPDPDLPPIEISREWTDRVTAEAPELPRAKRVRYQSDFGLSDYDSRQLTSSREVSALFEEAAALSAKPKEAANLIMGDLMRVMGDDGILPESLDVDAKKLAALIGLVSEGKINRTVGKQVFLAIFRNGTDPEVYVKERGLLMVRDDSLIADTVAAVLAENPKSVADYKNGTEKAFGFLVGQVMRAMKGKADPKAVNEALRESLK